jgi:ribose 5-phosphate isomerase B
MRIAVASDEELPILLQLTSHLAAHGHHVTSLPCGPWAKIAIGVAREVSSGRADRGIVLCHTGTGVSIAANKVKGVRAALSVDPETAAGSRKWNDSNVLALSLRLLRPEVAEGILDAWLTTPYAGTEDESLEAIRREETPTGS